MKATNTTEHKELLTSMVQAKTTEELHSLFNRNYVNIMSMVKYYANRCRGSKSYNSLKDELEQYMLIKFWSNVSSLNSKYREGRLNEKLDACKYFGFVLHNKTKEFFTSKLYKEHVLAQPFTDCEMNLCSICGDNEDK